MFSQSGQAFADLSEEKVQANLEFVRHLKNTGEHIQVPCRSGLQDAVIHRSVNRIPAPVIFEIYGGCFSQGTVFNNDHLRSAMQQATDYTVIGLDYRKSPRYPYPCGLQDVFDAVCYFHDHASEYNIDPDNMATWGHSAGGNFACVLALLAKETGRFSLRAQLLDYPYLDAWLPGIQKTNSPIGLTAELLDAMNEIYAPDLSTRHDYHVSPVYAPRESLRGTAPSAFVICGVDPLCAESEKMIQMNLEAGVPVLARKFTEASHGFMEHWFFKEWYMDTLSAEERASMPPNIGPLAEEALCFMASAAEYYMH